MADTKFQRPSTSKQSNSDSGKQSESQSGTRPTSRVDHPEGKRQYMDKDQRIDHPAGKQQYMDKERPNSRIDQPGRPVEKNPVPEIMPDLAKEAGARIVGTGRSDFPNQVNNVLVFPGIFRGALEGNAIQITEEMKLAAAEGLAALVKPEELSEDYILPEAFNPIVADAVSKAVRDNIAPDNRRI